jgi:hypothetical protein
MKRLSTKGLLTIMSLVLVLSAMILSILPNSNNHEVRTMKVYEVVGEITYLIDGNNEVYGMYDSVYLKYNDLLVTVDNQGTKDLKDDIILNWKYKN